MSVRASNFWRLVLMLPCFIIGAMIPVNIVGFSGNGPPDLQSTPYSPVTPVFVPPISYPAYAERPRVSRPVADPQSEPGIVRFFRGFYDSFADRFVSASVSPVTIKLVVLAVVFVAATVLMRFLVIWSAERLGLFLRFLVHMIAVPSALGFLAVASSWGIYETVTQHWGVVWAAPVLSLAAAIASLFSLAVAKRQ